MARKDIHISGIEGGSGRFIAGFVNTPAGGFQITMNMFMKALLTDLTSDPFDRTYGSAFSELPGSNLGGRMDIVRSMVFDSVANVTTKIMDYQLGIDAPRSQRLSNARVTSLEEVEGPGFIVYVLLTNAAGVSMVSVLPHVEL